MTYLYEALPKPTRLYIKQCPHCGLKYFGQSATETIEDYHGSGKRWKKHLKKHKVSPIHLWNSDWYYDTSIKRFAVRFSKINKIVESKKWANLKDENGLDGGGVLGGFKGPHKEETKNKMSLDRTGQANNFFGKTHTDESRIKISMAKTGVSWGSHSEETKKKMSEVAMGKPGTNNGKKFGPKTADQKKRISEATKNAMKNVSMKQPLVACPHCDKMGGSSNMKRYHFNNCLSRSDK